MTEDPKAEASLLCCCLIDGVESLSKCLTAGMVPEWLAVDAHRILFNRMTLMLAAGKSLDVAVVAQELNAGNELNAVGGYQFLSTLSSEVSTTLGFADYLERIRCLFVIRSVGKEAARLLEACKQYQNQAVAEIVDGPLARILSLSTASNAKDESRWPQVVIEALKAAETLIKAKRLPPETIVSWPWPTMDHYFEPMQRGQLVVVGARPSVGKSSLARQCIVSAARNGHSVYLDTLEVKPMQVALQMAASLSNIGVRDLARVHALDQAMFKQALQDLDRFGITPSSRDRSLARIVARLKALKAADKIDFAVIDHGGLLDDVALVTKEEKIPSIGRLTKTLKLLAGELNIVVMLLWQLNRLSANDGNREPKVSDLRDCGSLEEDADKVILIHRPTEDEITGEKQPETASREDCPRFYQKISQAKGRDDGTSSMGFYFTRRTTTFAPVEKPK